MNNFTKIKIIKIKFKKNNNNLSSNKNIDFFMILSKIILK
jgi:hypothetical protein